MPRTFPTSIQGELNKRLGTEPLIIVEIEWVPGGRVAYSDRKLNGEDYPFPQLHQVGQFDTTTIVDGSSDSQSVQVTLSDIDGELRNIIDTQDIHLRPVRILMGFQGFPLSEAALMFEGIINSEIVWDEGSRTLKFDVLSQLEDNEVGFTMEDGDFPFVPPADRNQPWPLVFGTVCNMETVRVTTNRKGFLVSGQGVVDPTIEDRLCQAKLLICPFERETVTTTDPITGETTSEEVVTERLQQNCLTSRFNIICGIITERTQQEEFVQETLTVANGEDFPQGTTITIQIADVRFEGIMEGDIFTISETFHPDLEIENPPCVPINEASNGFRFLASQTLIPCSQEVCDNGGSEFQRDIVDGAGASLEYFNSFEEGRFIWLPPGSEVLLAAESEIVHLVSLIPGTVNEVAAYRTYGDVTLLSEVDPSRYTVVTSDFGAYDVTEVRLNTQLSLIQDEDWDDTIYVSFTSSVGPNPVDAIDYLVNTYTDFTIDNDSFNSVRLDLANYPANFYIKERRSVLEVMRDIAFQFRCAVFIRDNTVFLVYLSKEPDSFKTLTETDIVANSFMFNHSSTESLQTSHLINWSDTEAAVFQDAETEFEFVLKHNIPSYGTINATYDYFTQNTFSTILKSATFWMIRRANTWRLVSFSTPITHLDLDVFDCITLDIEQFPTTKVVITSTNYNVDDNTIDFTAWTPIRSGTTQPYIWAWPALQSPNAIFPLNEEQPDTGDGSGLTVVPPMDHPLFGGFDPETADIQTAGDRNPSDLDDSFPIVECRIATGAEIQDTVEPEIRPFEPLAQQNQQEALDRQEIANGGGGGQGDDGDEDTVCGQPRVRGSGCNYIVTVFYVTPDLVTTTFVASAGCKAGGPCSRTMLNQGRVCTGAIHSFCHSFGALFSATFFQSSRRQEAEDNFNNCLYITGVTAISSVSGITTVDGPGPFDKCDPVPPEGAGGAGVEGPQTTTPGLSSGDSSTAPDAGSLPGGGDAAADAILLAGGGAN